jgi:hypothetical protein
VQIAVSIFFAPLYPLSFLFTWIMVFCDYYIMSRMLIFWNRRPDPRTSFTIGHWKTIIYALSWVLPISGSFILTTRYAPEYNKLAKFTLNIMLILLNFFVKHVV